MDIIAPEKFGLRSMWFIKNPEVLPLVRPRDNVIIITNNIVLFGEMTHNKSSVNEGIHKLIELQIFRTVTTLKFFRIAQSDAQLYGNPSSHIIVYGNADNPPLYRLQIYLGYDLK